MLAGRALSRPGLDRRRTARRAGRCRPGGSPAGAGRGQRPAAGGGRRRAYACQGAPARAGRADRPAPEDDGIRRGLCAVPERRAPPAHPIAPVAPLSAGPARRNAECCRALRVFARRTALRISGGNHSGRRNARVMAARRDRTRPVAPLSGRRAGRRAGAGRARVEADRRDGLRGLFPDGVRHRPLCPRAADPLPGARLGGQLGGVLRARHHRGRSGALGLALRALHLEGTRRAAGYRRRFRTRTARGGDPVHLRQIRSGAGGAGGGGDHLADQGGACAMPAGRSASASPRSTR